MVVGTLPPSEDLWEFRVTLASAVVDEEPDKFLNVVSLAEAHLARGDEDNAVQSCDAAERLAVSEREQRQLALFALG